MGGTCTIEFRNVASGPGVNSFGKDAKYGTTHFAKLGLLEFRRYPDAQHVWQLTTT
jgi:hypothetical protein